MLLCSICGRIFGARLVSRVLKYGFLDLVHYNCMRIHTNADGPNSIVSSSIEEYIKYEHHRLNLMAQLESEDIKEERKYYGNVITCHCATVTVIEA